MFSALAHDEAYYADKVNLFVALAPVTKIANTEDPLLKLTILFYDDIERTADLFRIHSVLN